MKKVIAIVMLLGFAQVAPVVASPLVVRCSAEKSWGNEIIKVHIDMTLPEKTNRFVFVSDRENEHDTLPDATPVGVGTIEITEVLGKAKQSHRHKFFVTRIPDEKNSLVGFYLTRSYVNSIRAELWQKEKRFLYFDTYNNEVLRGDCQ